MDGKNASGRRISLLNDTVEPTALALRPSSTTPSLCSRTSSYTSSPVGSPPTLVRTDSSDSSDLGGSLPTPSPLTPDFACDNMGSPFYPPPKDPNSPYPPPYSTGPLPPYTFSYHGPAYFQRPPQVEPPAPPPPASQSTPSANPRSKKNSYPCPMAAQFNCADHFTTSGHAARHAKKHTGKKDARCPECNKAFTRKDNMEQHRRTHQSGRNATKPLENIAKRAKKQPMRPKLSPLQSAVPSFGLNSSLVTSPSSPSSPDFAFSPAVQPVDTFSPEFVQRPYHLPALPSNSYPQGNSTGLDALAMAASGEKRKHQP